VVVSGSSGGVKDKGSDAKTGTLEELRDTAKKRKGLKEAGGVGRVEVQGEVERSRKVWESWVPLEMSNEAPF